MSQPSSTFSSPDRLGSSWAPVPQGCPEGVLFQLLDLEDPQDVQSQRDLTDQGQVPPVPSGEIEAERRGAIYPWSQSRHRTRTELWDAGTLFSAWLYPTAPPQYAAPAHGLTL